MGALVTGVQTCALPISAQMKALEHGDEERRLLEQLTGLAAEVEALQAATVYRFGAARAYDALIRSRLAELRETRVVGSQTIQEFMERRFPPAMRPCAPVAKPPDQLSRRVPHASTLPPTRLHIPLEDPEGGWV